MSHIFDALQRSESERNGVDLREIVEATDLLEAAERAAAVAEPLSTPFTEAPPKFELPLQPLPPSGLSEFESLPVSIPPDNRLVSLTDKDGLAAEKFRYLAVRLRQLQQVRPLKKLLITSTIPEEGKTMVAANLACTLARKREQKTLLMDGDLRRPNVARQFGLGRVAGLSEWLHRGSGPISSIYRLEAAGLWVLPAGSTPQNPLELIQGGGLQALTEQLSASFDWIVIDSPPVLPLADTSVWARLADGILLVTRQGTTQKEQLKRGLEALDQSKLLGALINCSTHVAHTDYYYRYSQQSAIEKVNPEN